MANPTGTKVGFAVTTGAASTATAQEDLGVKRFEVNGDVYQYVKATTTITQYSVEVAVSTDGYTLTPSAGLTQPAVGVAMIAANGTYPYHWVKKIGVLTVNKSTDQNVAAYEVLQAGTAGNAYKIVATGNQMTFGYALAAATTTITQVTACLAIP